MEVHPLWKVAIGLAIVGIVSYKLPMIEIFSVFFTFFLIPIGILAALGLISDGAIGLLNGHWNGFVEAVQERAESMAHTASVLKKPEGT